MEVIDPWFLYLWTRLDAVNSLAFGLGFVSFFVLGISCLVYAIEKESLPPVKVFVVLGGILFLSVSVKTLVPDKKDAALIWLLPKIVNNEQVQQEAGEFYQLAKEALKESLPSKED